MEEEGSLILVSNDWTNIRRKRKTADDLLGLQKWSEALEEYNELVVQTLNANKPEDLCYFYYCKGRCLFELGVSPFYSFRNSMTPSNS